jgi:hypothetical protein
MCKAKLIVHRVVIFIHPLVVLIHHGVVLVHRVVILALPGNTDEASRVSLHEQLVADVVHS